MGGRKRVKKRRKKKEERRNEEKKKERVTSRLALQVAFSSSPSVTVKGAHSQTTASPH